uniref:Uncharacterized protein n=1 Tax=Tanacetum cinerariifolium TaxID=118510 RepID=A0A6L2NND8_TANCI|nr:hypothetical protein [Tanacetum cinerariifolium]
MDVIDWDFLANLGLARNFFDIINIDAFTGPQWANLFQINKPVYRELVLGGESRIMSLLELGWRVGLYSFEQSRLASTRSGFSRGETVKADHELLIFWTNIGDDEFVMGGTAVKKVRDPRVRLAHRCIVMTILGRKESTHMITEIASFSSAAFMPRGTVRSFGLMTNEMVDALSVAPREYVFKKKSLISMKVLLDLGGRDQRWGQMETWMARQTEQANWMYDDTIRQFQYMSTRVNLDPHLQIDLFLGREANYLPYGYTCLMPSGYEHRFGPTPPGGFE